MKKLLLVLTCFSVACHAGSTYLDVKGGVNTSGNSLGLAADAGYAFSPYLGVEGGFTDALTNNNSSWVDAAVRGTLPLSNVVALYGRVGIDFRTSGWGDDVGALLGGGIEFNLSNNWKLDVEDYNLTNGPNFLMAGAKFNY